MCGAGTQAEDTDVVALLVGLREYAEEQESVGKRPTREFPNEECSLLLSTRLRLFGALPLALPLFSCLFLSGPSGVFAACPTTSDWNVQCYSLRPQQATVVSPLRRQV
jgi:hypothetical protein